MSTDGRWPGRHLNRAFSPGGASQQPGCAGRSGARCRSGPPGAVEIGHHHLGPAKPADDRCAKNAGSPTDAGDVGVDAEAGSWIEWEHCTSRHAREYSRHRRAGTLTMINPIPASSSRRPSGALLSPSLSWPTGQSDRLRAKLASPWAPRADRAMQVGGCAAQNARPRRRH
jgi:hypothetical protein